MDNQLPFSREITILLTQVVVAFIVSLKQRHRTVIAALFLCGYGTTMSSVRVDLTIVPLTLGAVIAPIIAWFFFPKFHRNISIFATILAISALIASLNSAITEIFKSILFLFYAFAGLSVGYYFANLDEEQKINFLGNVIIFLSVGISMTFILKEPYTGFRDVTFGMLIALPIVYSTFRLSPLTLLGATVAIGYLLLGTSRGLALGLLSGVGLRLMSWLTSQKSNLKNIIIVCLALGLTVASFSTLIFVRLYKKPFLFEDRFDWFLQILSLKTRYKSLIYEFEVFSENLLFGNGIAYYFPIFSENFSSWMADGTKYIAFNHIGSISTLAQGGVTLFFVTILIPLALTIINWKILFNKRDYFSTSILCVFFGYQALFFFSASPVSQNFNEIVTYYFLVGYIIYITSSNHSRLEERV